MRSEISTTRAWFFEPFPSLSPSSSLHHFHLIAMCRAYSERGERVYSTCMMMNGKMRKQIKIMFPQSNKYNIANESRTVWWQQPKIPNIYLKQEHESFIHQLTSQLCLFDGESGEGVARDWLVADAGLILIAYLTPLALLTDAKPFSFNSSNSIGVWFDDLCVMCERSLKIKTKPENHHHQLNNSARLSSVFISLARRNVFKMLEHSMWMEFVEFSVFSLSSFMFSLLLLHVYLQPFVRV